MSVKARNLSLRSHFGADRHPSLSLPIFHFALFAGDPTVAGVEPNGSAGYARAAVANDAALWGALDGTAIQAFSAVDIVWPAATGLYSTTGPLDHWAIFDNATGGTLWYSAPLTAPIQVTGAGDVPRIPAGALSVTQL